MQEELVYLPKDEDLEGAASALLRLQDTYALPTEQIASGKLQGVKESLILSGISPRISSDRQSQLSREQAIKFLATICVA